MADRVFVDLNPRSGDNAHGHLLFDGDAINIGSLRNLFACPIGERGRIFQPEYGTYLYQFLQEPLDGQTAARIRSSLIQSLERWEPRIRLIEAGTAVVPQPLLPGYYIRLQYVLKLKNQMSVAEFRIRSGGV